MRNCSIQAANFQLDRSRTTQAVTEIYTLLTARPWAEAVHGLQAVFFCSFWVERPILPLGHIVSWTSNHTTYVYSPKVVETVIHGQCYGYCLCVKYIFIWFYQSDGFEGNITLNHSICKDCNQKPLL